MRGGLQMKKIRIAALCALLTLGTAGVSQAAFTVGGENGWQLSTDGIVDVFATYHTTSPAPDSRHIGGLLDGTGNGEYNQRFGIGVGLLPSVVAFNVKAPTVGGVESTVRIGIYPSIQNGNNEDLGLQNNDRFSVGPNIDFREIFYTARGKYGEILAGRALNLFQGKNILTDMTLLTAGTVSGRANTVTLGHIGYGYLYTGFGPQIRYTTPDFAGVKLALEIGEPYAIHNRSDKTGSPRLEAELSYAKVFGGTSVQAWLAGIFQNATINDGSANDGRDVQSVGGAYGVGVGFAGLNLLGSGYGGRGLGSVSAQDGQIFGGSTDSNGKGRLFWGFLAQATYQLTPEWKIGANYGQTRVEENQADVDARQLNTAFLIKKRESAVATVTYNWTKFIQFVGEYIYAQNTWHDGASQHSNQFALGTMFYW